MITSLATGNTLLPRTTTGTGGSAWRDALGGRLGPEAGAAEADESRTARESEQRWKSELPPPATRFREEAMAVDWASGRGGFGL